MSLEQRVRSTLREAGARITPNDPHVEPPRTIEPSQRRVLRPATAFLAGAVGVLILGAAALLIGPYDPNAIDPAESHGVETVEIADLAVPVVDSEPKVEEPRIWLGLAGPRPQFDTSGLGPDLSFTPGEPEAGDLEEGVIDAVYVGDLDNQGMYIYSRAAPSIFDWFSEIIFGNLSGQTIGTTLACCMGGTDMDREGGFPGVSGSRFNDEPPVIVAQWFGLSPDVSVVAYQFDGEFVGWQTPVAGVSAIQPAESPSDYVLVAFDAQGRELDRFGPHTGPVFPDDREAMSFLLSEEGVEIRPEDIPNEALVDVIDINQEDSIFAVPADEFQVYLVLPETGEPHVYATSCDVLETADPPANGTCLERTVNGQRVTGVFNYEPDRN